MIISGKTALITGASRGIGRAIAIELAQHGIKRLLLVARDRQRLDDLAQLLDVLGVEVIPLVFDLTQPVDVNVAIARAWRDYGPIQLLVNCAGVAHQTPFLESKLPQVQEEVATNFMGMYTVTRLIARRMAAQHDGQIINVSSLMGKVAAPTMATYSATKFAIIGFTHALRSELAPYNVTVKALLPTLTDTDMAKNMQWFRGVVPVTPEQVAKALVAGLHHDTPEILVGWQSYLAIWCNQLAPRLMEKIVRMTTPQPSQVSTRRRDKLAMPLRPARTSMH